MCGSHPAHVCALNIDKERNRLNKKSRKEKEKEKEELPYESYRNTGAKLQAKRIWFCTKRREGCKGTSSFLSWKQLMNKPTCPNCGAAMMWHQWGAIVT